MKKLSLAFVSLLVFSGCAATDAPADFSQSCTDAGGTWLAEFNECEYASQTWCDENGGTFSECESACRHDPDAEFCTMQCVAVCAF